MSLNIAKFDRYDLVNTPGTDKPAFTVWFSGCSMHCPGCYNEVLWDGTKGQVYDTNVVLFDICHECDKQELDTIVLIGGEPLEQTYSDIQYLAYKLSSFGYKIWLYTGWEFEQIPEALKKYLYTIKCGKYDESKATGGFPASSNQRIFRQTDGVWNQITL